jgi:hypothetical protein
MLRRVDLAGTDVSKERITSIIKVTGIGELETTLAVTSNRSTPQRWRRYISPKRPFLQEPRGLTYQMTTFFIVTAVKTSSVT